LRGSSGRTFFIIARPGREIYYNIKYVMMKINQDAPFFIIARLMQIYNKKHKHNETSFASGRTFL